MREPTRRDFLLIGAGAVGVAGAGYTVWTLVDEMNATKVDIGGIEPGQTISVQWNGKPVLVSHRTPAAIEAARAVALNELRDPATDQSRAQKPEWLVVIGICTHQGCGLVSNEGPYQGYFCPCHGSVYDTSGRIRQGPAPANLAVPPYKFTSDTTLKIG